MAAPKKDPSKAKSQRINAKLTIAQKQQMDEALKLLREYSPNLKESDFIVMAIEKEAKRVLKMKE